MKYLLVAVVLGAAPGFAFAQDSSDLLKMDPVKQKLFLDSVSKKLGSTESWRIGQPLSSESTQKETIAASGTASASAPAASSGAAK